MSEWCEWTSERCVRTSKRTSEWPSNFVSIHDCPEPQCDDDRQRRWHGPEKMAGWKGGEVKGYLPTAWRRARCAQEDRRVSWGETKIWCKAAWCRTNLVKGGEKKMLSWKFDYLYMQIILEGLWRQYCHPISYCMNSFKTLPVPASVMKHDLFRNYVRWYGVIHKKLFHKSEEKMLWKMKMI